MGGGAGKSLQRVDSGLAIKVLPKDSPPRPPSLGPDERPTLLSADVGGTSSRLQLFYPPKDENLRCTGELPPIELPILMQKYSNNKFDSLLEIIQDFLGKSGIKHPPHVACLAVAGVVVDNKCNFVNLGWKLDGGELARKLGIWQVHLINDFVAQGYGVLTLDRQNDLDLLQDAPVLDGAPIAVIGAGTGLGVGFMTLGENGDYEVWPSESGHSEFAPRQNGSSTLEFEMLKYLQIKFSAKSRISVERIVSGKGIANIYQFLSWRFPEKVNKDVHREFVGVVSGAGIRDDPAVVVRAANDGTCELCKQAVEMFVGAYGAHAGVVALKFMPFGGLFVTGGVTVRTRDFILGHKDEGGKDNNAFLEAFRDKGRVTPMLYRVPLYVVKHEDLGERGVKLKTIRMYAETQMVRQVSKGHMSP